MYPTSRYTGDFNISQISKVWKLNISQISKVWMLDSKQTTPHSSNRLSISGAGFEGAVVFKSLLRLIYGMFSSVQHWSIWFQTIFLKWGSTWCSRKHWVDGITSKLSLGIKNWAEQRAEHWAEQKSKTLKAPKEICLIDQRRRLFLTDSKNLLVLNALWLDFLPTFPLLQISIVT